MPGPTDKHDPTDLLAWVADRCGASRATRGARIQSLWSGYGEIVRVHLDGAEAASVILKHVRPPSAANHPRGWSTNRSHARKLRSYAIERAFYVDFAPRTIATCRVPRCLGATTLGDGAAFVLEDLDAAGFGARRASLRGSALDAALRWLASFHVRFLGVDPAGLWPEGTYWHLATRPDELAATTDPRLKAAAHTLDARLASARYRTLVHGDAKVANLCFTPDGRDVAAVDFQYVGGGCGMKDVAYLLGSAMTERELAREADAAVDAYFGHVHAAAREHGSDADVDALEREWRALYPVAWADFARFLSGWAPGHGKLHGYTRRMVDAALG